MIESGLHYLGVHSHGASTDCFALQPHCQQCLDERPSQDTLFLIGSPTYLCEESEYSDH